MLGTSLERAHVQAWTCHDIQLATRIAPWPAVFITLYSHSASRNPLKPDPFIERGLHPTVFITLYMSLALFSGTPHPISISTLQYLPFLIPISLEFFTHMGRSQIISLKFFPDVFRSKTAIDDAIEPKKYSPSQTSTITEPTTEPPRSSTSTTSSDGAPPTESLPFPSDLSTTNFAPQAETLSSISELSTTPNVSICNYSSTSYYDSSVASNPISIRTSFNSIPKTAHTRYHDLSEASNPSSTRTSFNSIFKTAHTRDPSTTNAPPPDFLSWTSFDGAPPTESLRFPSDLSTTNFAPRAETLSFISELSTTPNVSICNYSSTSYYDSSVASNPISTRTSFNSIPKTAHTRYYDSSEASNPSSTRTSFNSIFKTAHTRDPSTTNAPPPDFLSWTSNSLTTNIVSNLHDSIPAESPFTYDFNEISDAPKIFLANNYPSTSDGSWRCTLRGKDVVVYQGKLRRSMFNSQLEETLSVICKSYHMSVISLLGISISGDHIYLVYNFTDGMTLAKCLRDPSKLSTWISRMQVLTDVAHGLDYIHNDTGRNRGVVLKHINSSSIIVNEASFHFFRAKICHFGTAEFCGETDENIEIVEEESVRGYMAPEFQLTGVATQKSDVYSFGVLVLELLSGKYPLECKNDMPFMRNSINSMIETARKAIEVGGNGGHRSRWEKVLTELWFTIWVDWRLNNNFPVEVAKRLTRLALECVHVDPDKRPVMRRVTLKISKLYMESWDWSRVWSGARTGYSGT